MRFLISDPAEGVRFGQAEHRPEGAGPQPAEQLELAEATQTRRRPARRWPASTLGATTGAPGIPVARAARTPHPDRPAGGAETTGSAPGRRTPGAPSCSGAVFNVTGDSVESRPTEVSRGEVGQLGRLGAAASGHGIVPYLSRSGGQTALHRKSESVRPLLEGTRRCYTTPLPDRLPDPRTGLAPEVAQLFPQEAKHVRHTAAALLGRLIRAIRAIVVLPALLLARFGRIDRSTFEICSWLDATLCVCHLRLVNGYVRRIAIDDDSRSS